MNIVVVSKEDIEAPWRAECEFLQSVIAELELKKGGQVQVQVVKEMVKDTEQVEWAKKI